MNWISNVVRPKIRNYFARRDTPENLWIKCPETGQLVFYKDVESNQFVIPGSNYHMRMGAMARMKSLFDGETWFDIAIPDVPVDPLKFRDERRYTDRLKDARGKTGTTDAIKLGYGKLDGLPVVIAVQDFDFMGGSLGMAAGEAVVKGLQTAVDQRTAFIMFAAPGRRRPRAPAIGAQMIWAKRTGALAICRCRPEPQEGRAPAASHCMNQIDSIVTRLLGLHPKRIDLTLERMWRILAALGHPERRLPPVIHVAGTNGKGSTIAFMRAILEAAGLAVHAYTSPHLVRFNERFRLGATLQ